MIEVLILLLFILVSLGAYDFGRRHRIRDLCKGLGWRRLSTLEVIELYNAAGGERDRRLSKTDLSCNCVSLPHEAHCGDGSLTSTTGLD